MLGIDIPITPRKGHILVGSRQEPVFLRNVMDFGYLMNKFGRERIVDEWTAKHGVAIVLEPSESQNLIMESIRQFVGYYVSIDIDVLQTLDRSGLHFLQKL